MDNILGGLTLWLTLCCFAFFLTLIIHLLWDGRRSRILRSAAEMLVLLVLTQILMDHIKYHNRAFIEKPVALLLIALVMTGIAALEMQSCIRARKRSLSLMSVKECMDELPVGICFYWDGGLTKLTNRRMNSIACKLTGSGIMDAEHFQKTVFSGMETPVVRLEDGAAYSFDNRVNTLDGRTIHELLAFDVTEEYRLTEELREKQKKVQKMNRRLKALNATIQYIIMDKETLHIKMHIHDSFGEMLLMTRHFLADPENTDTKEMLSLWRRNTALLKDEEREHWQKPCFFSLTHADSLGIRIEMNGELPEDETLSSVVDSAITVHVTNVLRHAEGDTAYISIEKTADGYVMRFTNNGRPPAAPLKETGGLANLRCRIEALGGTMTINSAPQFEMILHLPENAQEEY
ncbi:MAG: hypothetical protein J5722_09700, partial [Oscillospiraceae bacterium]|nr:hypothetical protein [Oscillospiraceae bacterium]